MRIDFIIGGVQKGGTTALAEFVGQHPDVGLSNVKEPHYFSSDINRRYEEHAGREIPFLYKTPEQYLELFRDAGDAQVIGESSVYYLFSEVAASAIAGRIADPREFL